MGVSMTDRQRPGRRPGEPPQHGDGEDLLLPSDSRCLGRAAAVAVEERDGERRRVDVNPFDQGLLAQQEAERLGDEVDSRSIFRLGRPGAGTPAYDPASGRPARAARRRSSRANYRRSPPLADLPEPSRDRTSSSARRGRRQSQWLRLLVELAPVRSVAFVGPLWISRRSPRRRRVMAAMRRSRSSRSTARMQVRPPLEQARGLLGAARRASGPAGRWREDREPGRAAADGSPTPRRAAAGTRGRRRDAVLTFRTTGPAGPPPRRSTASSRSSRSASGRDDLGLGGFLLPRSSWRRRRSSRSPTGSSGSSVPAGDEPRRRTRRSLRRAPAQPALAVVRAPPSAGRPPPGTRSSARSASALVRSRPFSQLAAARSSWPGDLGREPVDVALPAVRRGILGLGGPA